jgi:hypothetical protein
MNFTTTAAEQRSSGWGILRGLQSSPRERTRDQSADAVSAKWAGPFEKRVETEVDLSTCEREPRPVCEDCGLPMYAADFILWSRAKICSDCRLRRRLFGRPQAFRIAGADRCCPN